jgi:serine/threonine protein kinase
VSQPPLPNVIGERYRPIRLLGRGGGGSVYEAEHLHTGAKVALKLLAGLEGASPEAVARFRREARLAAAIDSEHVVRITDAGTADELAGTPFLVMELMQGRTLEQEAQKPLEPARVIEFLSQVARALERAHAAGIIHRDLTPDNMFITQREDGRALVKLLDFGIAKNTSSAVPQGSGHGTEQGTVLGTPIYMSPEQAQGQAALVDARTDTWALGMIAFRLLFGLPYFAPDHTLRLLHRVVFEPVTPPSELGFVATPAFDAWFLRSCSHDRSQRFTSPAEQMRELAVALGDLQQVEIRKHILEARAQKYSASTEQQIPTRLDGGYSTPNTPWADGPMLQTPSSDSARRAAPVSLAGSTPPHLPSISAPVPRFALSRAIIPLTFAALVVLSAGVWLWKVTRSVPLTDETMGPVAEPPAAATGKAVRGTPKSDSAPAAAGEEGRVPTSAPDAAMPLPKNASQPRPETGGRKPVRAGTRPGLPARETNYDPLGDRH